MRFPFNARRGLIVLQAELFGPSSSILLRLALDTGATSTLINAGPLTAIGYEPSLAPLHVQVTTGSGVEYMPRLLLSRFKVMGQERFDFPVLAHSLPPGTGVDGLLGLDFLRGQELNIDFRNGRLTLG